MKDKMYKLLDDETRAEMVTRITCNYILAFNGPDMRPPDQITTAKFMATMIDAFDDKFPRPDSSE